MNENVFSCVCTFKTLVLKDRNKLFQVIMQWKCSGSRAQGSSCFGGALHPVGSLSGSRGDEACSLSPELACMRVWGLAPTPAASSSASAALEAWHAPPADGCPPDALEELVL